MNDAALCLFPWDLQDEGLELVLQFAADMGLTSLFLASVYHAGWFVRPHNPKQKCYMAEDGVAYFHPTESFYEATPLKPKIAKIAEHTDWFASVSRRLDDFGLRLTAWNVCMHSTRLGLAHPDETVQNAWGDSYPHALCPASPAVRAYVLATVKDLASQYPLQSIFLEALDYRGRQHGHHHERDGTPFGPLENELLDISFSIHDIAQAQLAGVDARPLCAAIRNHLDEFLAHIPHRPPSLPETMEQFMHTHPNLSDYLAVLDDQVASLADEIKADLEQFDVLLEGTDEVDAYDIRLVGAYGQPPSVVADLTRRARQQCAPHQKLRIGFRLGFDSPDQPGAITSADQARECVQAAVENGADSFFFYNYSESPKNYLNWIKPAIDGLIPMTA